MILNLLPGIVETDQYKAWKFPGGEIHFKLSEDTIQAIADSAHIEIKIRLTSAENILFLAIVSETLHKDFSSRQQFCNISYMPYQQADRDFGIGECFSLSTIANILNSLPIDSYRIFDPHSDVTPAVIYKTSIEDNSSFIAWTLESIDVLENNAYEFEKLTILSPDAGAYKKIFKLCEKINFQGSIETANKYRDTKDGQLHVRFSKKDFEGGDVLIIDDICMGGRTFIELAKQLAFKNVGNLYLAVSHGIFSNGYEELLKHFASIYTTNSYKEYDDVIEKRLKVYNIF